MSSANKRISVTPAAQAQFEEAPIKPEWVLDGQPKARVAQLSASADRLGSTFYWDCTEGKFNWRFNSDETVTILEGSVIVTADGQPRRLSPGDTAYFPAGSTSVWHVERYVRKVAFIREANPFPFNYAVRAWRKLLRLLSGDKPGAVFGQPVSTAPESAGHGAPGHHAGQVRAIG
jgi:uncharacterized cupin superfamily protein